jgi:hypothetical protein
MPEQAEYVDGTKVTHRDASKVERVVHALFVPASTLEPGTTLTSHYTVVLVATPQDLEKGREKTLTERLNAAYDDELEPEEKEFLELAKESYRRRVNAEE